MWSSGDYPFELLCSCSIKEEERERWAHVEPRHCQISLKWRTPPRSHSGCSASETDYPSRWRGGKLCTQNSRWVFLHWPFSDKSAKWCKSHFMAKGLSLFIQEWFIQHLHEVPIEMVINSFPLLLILFRVISVDSVRQHSQTVHMASFPFKTLSFFWS